jgi:hypothetical protein
MFTYTGASCDKPSYLLHCNGFQRKKPELPKRPPENESKTAVNFQRVKEPVGAQGQFLNAYF